MKKVQSKLRPTEIGVIKTFSLSPDDEVGEIAVECSGCTYYYNNLAELCEKWEDYEQPKRQIAYYIDRDGKVVPYKQNEFYPKRVFDKEQNKAIGNYFKTREEAEKAVEKLKAWKRLKDKGFMFCGTGCINKNNVIYFEFGERPLTQLEAEEAERELEICFGDVE